VSAKQDRQGARTPADLERKYSFGKQFAEILGIATDARNYATLIEAELSERYTMMLRDTESIIMEAVSKCVTEEELEYTVSTQLKLMSDGLLLTFKEATDALGETDSDLNSKFKELYSYISMVGGILTFRDSVSTRTLALNNGRIQFADSGVVFGEWDGDNFYTGNLVIRVSERAQFGNFAYVPRTDGSLMFLKVGG
jgi:hypothetical protein